MKALNILCGIISIIAAVICLAHPFAAQIAYGYLCAIVIGCLGIIVIISYFMNRKAMKVAGTEAVVGTAGLALGILGVIFMVLNIEIPGFVYGVQEFGAVMLMVFMLIEGFGMIIFAVKSRGIPGRIPVIIFGCLMVIACLFGVTCPVMVISIMGAFMGINFALYGINRFIVAFQ